MAQVTHISDIYSQNDNNISKVVSKKRLGCFNKTTKILKEEV